METLGRRRRRTFVLKLAKHATIVCGKLQIEPTVILGALTVKDWKPLLLDPTNAQKAAWFIRDHAITVLPSVASLAALRRTGKPSAATRPMIGFGNPLLDGMGAEDAPWALEARSKQSCSKAPDVRVAALTVELRGVRPLKVRGGLVDVADIRSQVPLPETADELCAVARYLGVSGDEIRLGGHATETEIKRLSNEGDLAKYRIVHFATHGALAGQIGEGSEAGLVLTPPNAATETDDGYLTAPEIATLRLDADWVILSACNTAAGGAEGAEALSGLARVFFYAGSRALLVSHWAVDSDAAVKLITTAVGELSKEASIGRAEALRRAMLAVMADKTRPSNWQPASHPSVWAPFVIVGEGGAGR